MDETPNLTLPYIMAAQAQKHVTHNEAIRMLDAVVQLAVIDRDLTAPPGTPNDGERYIVGAASTGAWAGMDNQIAAWQDNAWIFYSPLEGWLAWLADEDKLISWDGAGWIEVSADTSVIQNANHVGINATADDTNRLSLNSPASLFNHDGAGHQQKINKNAATDTASVLYQTGFSGRAEIGLTGDDDFHFKVSPDGSTFHESFILDKDTGQASFKKDAQFVSINGGPLAGFKNKIINGDFQVAQRAESQTTGGTKSVDLWIVNSSGSSNLLVGRQLFTPGQTDVDGAPTNFLRVETIVAEDNFGLFYPIESVYTLQGLPVTLSFWVRGNFSSTLNFKLYQNFGAGGSSQVVQTTNFSASTSWQRKSINFNLPSLAGKTIGTGHYLKIEITNPVSEIWFMELADFQLEQGGIATPFERRPIGVELALCRRYFRKFQTAQDVNDLAFDMFATPTQSGSGPYDYDAAII